MKIQIIFIGKPQWEAGWPYLGYDTEPLKTSILNHLKKKYPEVEFSQSEMVT
ncbi:unnamed protein product, partial [marine sediment metagenome]